MFLLLILFSLESTVTREKVCIKVTMSPMLLNPVVTPQSCQQHVTWLITPFLKIFTFQSLGFQATIPSWFSSDLSRGNSAGTETQILLMHDLTAMPMHSIFERLEFSVNFIAKLCMQLWQNNSLFSPRICGSSVLYTGKVSFHLFSKNSN